MSGFHRKNESKAAAAQMAFSKATPSKLLSVDYRCVELGLALATFAAVANIQRLLYMIKLLRL